MIELSTYVFEPLRKDEEFILYRGRSENDPSRAAFGRDPASAGHCQVLLVAPVSECPRPETLKLLEHAYSVREELDRAWAARPIAIARHWDRTVLVMEDPGGVPLDELLGPARNQKIRTSF